MTTPQAQERGGSDVGLPPDGGFMRQREVLRSIPVSRSTLWRWVSAGAFPAPVKLSAHVSAWRVADVRQWMAERGQPRQGGGM